MIDLKILKKLSFIVIALATLLVPLSMPYKEVEVEAKAQTLRQLKNELAENERELEENKQQQAQTQSQISSSKKRIEQISQEKIQIEKDVADLTDEIEQLNKDIVSMNVEIKDLMSYYQLSNTGESAALEYVFDASTFTDFIYRMAITEQLGEHNSDLIKQYNQTISENEDKKVELANKTEELNDKEKELEEQVKQNQATLTKTLEGAVSIEDEIKNQKKLIDIYENTYKCKLDELLDDCLAGKLPPDTAFYRSVVSGRVSSNYGKRTYKLNGKWTSDFHYGVDMSATHGAKVYSSANGVVAAVFKKQSCGGNMVYINHLVNGKKYTTGYYHLADIKVKVGQTVSSTTVIGHVGGSPKYETWDHCSTGSHNHFTISTGNWGTTYKSYSGFISKQINPRKVVNFPALGKSFTSRDRKY